MKNFTLRYFFNGFYRFRVGTMQELRPWIALCEENAMPFKLFDEDNAEVDFIYDR